MEVFDSAEVFLRVKDGRVSHELRPSDGGGGCFILQHINVNVVIEFKDVQDGTFSNEQTFSLRVFGCGGDDRLELQGTFGLQPSTIECIIVNKTDERSSQSLRQVGLDVVKDGFSLSTSGFLLSLTLREDDRHALSIKCYGDNVGAADVEEPLVPMRKSLEEYRKRWSVREMEEAKEKGDYDARYSTIPQDKPEEWYQEQMKIATKQGNVARYRALMAADHNIFLNAVYQKWEDLYGNDDDEDNDDDDEDNDDDDEDDTEVARAPSSTLEDRMVRVEDRLALYHDQLETRLNTMDGRIGTILSFIERITKNLAQPPPMDFPSRTSTPDSHLYVA